MKEWDYKSETFDLRSLNKLDDWLREWKPEAHNIVMEHYGVHGLVVTIRLEVEQS